jgi:uncharacterized protein (TIGR02231 family)
MKRIITSIIVLAAINISKAATLEEEVVNSAINKVTVYTSTAYITREINLDIMKGSNVFRIKNLSPYINNQSIQILGTGDIIIHSYYYEVNYLSSIESDKEIRLLNTQIRDIEREILFKNSRIEVLKEQKDLMDKNKRLNENGLSVDELKKLVEYFDQKLTAIGNNILELGLSIQDLQTEKATLQNQLAQYNQNEKTPSGEIIVSIEGGNDLTSTLELSYLTTHAGWAPAYDIKVKDVESEIDLVFKATLFNNTREDWKNISLTFSNGNPNVNGILPELYPWYLDIIQPLYEERGSGISNKRSMPAALQSAMEAEVDLYEEPSVKPVNAIYAEQQTTVEYVIDKPYTMVANNKSVQVDLRTFAVPADYKYYAIPKIDRSAYLVARIVNWEQQGLLDGQANLYFQNRFVGKSYIDTRQLTDTFNISLGQDKSIIFERELTDMFQKKKVIGSDKIDTRGFRISVRNTKSIPVEIVIYDQIPVSVTNEIVVKTLETGGASFDKDSGKLTWELTLASKASQEMVFGYEVKYPKDEYVMLN